MEEREADRSGPSMRKPTARPEAAARQTACDRLILCVWVREQAQDDCGEKLRTVASQGSFGKKQTFRKSEFELLESCAKVEHLIKSGDTAMDASSQVTLDTRMFGVDGDQGLG